MCRIAADRAWHRADATLRVWIGADETRGTRCRSRTLGDVIVTALYLAHIASEMYRRTNRRSQPD